jgi:hypothetical protein
VLAIVLSMHVQAYVDCVGSLKAEHVQAQDIIEGAKAAKTEVGCELLNKLSKTLTGQILPRCPPNHHCESIPVPSLKITSHVIYIC